jgi:hypothetical protein
LYAEPVVDEGSAGFGVVANGFVCGALFEAIDWT